MISPGFIEGAAGLPWARDGLVRKLVVAHRQIIDSGGVPSGMIPGDADAAVDDAAARMHQIDQLLQPRLGEQRAFAPVVEPEEPDSVPVEQFGDLRQAFRGKVVFKFRIGGLLKRRIFRDLRPERQAAAGEFPIQPVRIVSAQHDAASVARLFQLPDQVAPERGGFHDIETGYPGIPQRESVVMLGGDHHILHPGVPDFLSPCVRVESRRVELTCECAVFPVWNRAAVRP